MSYFIIKNGVKTASGQRQFEKRLSKILKTNKGLPGQKDKATVQIALDGNLAGKKTLTYNDVARETFVSKNFFDLFPDKRDKLNEFIVEELNKLSR